MKSPFQGEDLGIEDRSGFLIASKEMPRLLDIADLVGLLSQVT
jgi:hypothetical protein